MYSKSQTASPKPSGFLTSIPSSISAPSLLLLPQQPQQNPPRKYYNTVKFSKDKSQKKQYQPVLIQEQQEQSYEQTNTTICNNSNNSNYHKKDNSTLNNTNNNSGSNGKSKFPKKINFLNKEKNNFNNGNNRDNNNKNINNNKKSNINKSSIIITNDYIINDMGLNSTSNIINNLKSVSIHSDGKVEIDKSVSKEVLATSNENLRTSFDKNNFKQSDIKLVVNEQKETDSKSSNNLDSKEGDEDEEIYPFSMNEEALSEYYNFLSILSDYIDHQIADDNQISITKNNDKKSTSNIFSVFNVEQAPEISIYDYILRIFKYLPFGTDIFIFSIIYLDRVIQQNPNIQISYLNIHRLFMASVLVASKYHNDKSLNNRYYAQVGGVTLSEMNLLEINFLILIDWQLLINPNTFNSYNNLIQLKIQSLDKEKQININNNNNNNQPIKENNYIISGNNNNNNNNNLDQNHQKDSCNIINNNQYLNYQQPQFSTYQQPQQQQHFYGNNNNNFRRSIKNKPPPRPNYLTYPIPSNQYHLYHQYYQQTPVYSGSYDDNNIYDYGSGYNTPHDHQTSNYIIDGYYQPQQQWINGSYYYQQQSNGNHYHR